MDEQREIAAAQRGLRAAVSEMPPVALKHGDIAVVAADATGLEDVDDRLRDRLLGFGQPGLRHDSPFFDRRNDGMAQYARSTGGSQGRRGKVVASEVFEYAVARDVEKRMLHAQRLP